jgi:hypothetical protein
MQLTAYLDEAGTRLTVMAGWVADDMLTIAT